MTNPLPTLLRTLQAGLIALASLACCLALPLNAQTITIRTLDTGTGGNTGQYTSQSIVNGNPAIAYYNVTESSLMFARNSAADGSGTWTVITMDHVGFVGKHTSLTVVNGNPAISYFDESNFDLKYVRANDADGTSWGMPATLDSTGIVGESTSLKMVNGNPAISYYDRTNYDLKYIRAQDTSGTIWGTPLTLDGIDLVGRYSSLEVINGNPAISYHDHGSKDLKYVRALDANGTNWGTPAILDVSDDVGESTSLAVVNGNPAISYYAPSSNNLRYVRANDASGMSWSVPVTVSSAVSGLLANQYTSLTIINGNPTISYYDSFFQDLKYVRANDASGTSWTTPVTVDSTGDVGLYSSLAVVNGNAAISYYDSTNGDLKWAMLTFDADGDGLRDIWELTYWPSTTGHSAIDDSDHDGYCELLELALGLNPTRPSAGGLPPAIDEGGYLTMTITKQAGVTYEVQSAGSLLPALPDSFSAASTTVLINNATTLKVRDNFLIGISPPRFMRVKVTASP